MRPASASSFSMSFFALNSEITFGGATFEHFGYDVIDLIVDGVDVADDSSGTQFTASGGSFVGTSPGVGGKWYEYAGGALSIEFGFTSSGTPYTGTFLAPVVRLRVFTEEPLDAENESNVFVDYELGVGTFDPAFADALGIPHQAIPTSPTSWFLLLEGDSTSSELVAHDGGIGFEFAPVPEPSLSVLAGLGLLAALGRMRTRRASRRT
jgi:hypothetical protein